MRNPAFISWLSDPICNSLERAMEALQKAWTSREKTGSFGEREIGLVNKAREELLTASIALEASELGICHEILNELIVLLENVPKTQKLPMFGSDALSYTLVRLPVYVRLVANGAPNTPAALFDVLNCLLLINGKAPRLADAWVRAIDLQKVDIQTGETDFIEVATPLLQYINRELSPALESLLENNDVYFLLETFDNKLASLAEVALPRRLNLFCWLLRGLVSNTKARAQQVDLLTVLCIHHACSVFRSMVDDVTRAEALVVDDLLYLMVVLLAYAPTRSRMAENIVEKLGVKASLPDAATVGEIRDQLGGANLSSVEEVYPLLVDELNRAVDLLNRATTSGRFNRSGIDASFKAIKHVASTLEAVGDLSLSKLLRDPQQTLDAALTQGSETTPEIDQAFDALTESIFFTRKSLKERMRGFAPDIFEDLPVDREVIYALIKEALVELRAIRKNLALHFETGEAHNELTQAIRSLAGVSSGLTLVDLGSTSKALRYLAIFIYESIRNNGTIEERQLKLAAAALVAVEMRLEYYGRGILPPARYTESAETALAELFGDRYTDDLPQLPDELYAAPNLDQHTHPADNFYPLSQRINEVAKSWDGSHDDSWSGLRNLLIELGTLASLTNYRLVDQLVREFSQVMVPYRDLDKVSPDVAAAAYEYVNQLAHTLVQATGESAEVPKESLLETRRLREVLATELGGLPLDNAETDESESADLGPSDVADQDFVEPVDPSLPAVDRELAAVFKKEFAGIRTVLEQALATFDKSESEAVVSEDLSRAIHTLRGVSHTIENPSMAEVFAAWDEIFHSKQSSKSPLSPEQIALFKLTVPRTIDVANALPLLSEFEDAEAHAAAIAETEFDEAAVIPDEPESTQVQPDDVEAHAETTPQARLPVPAEVPVDQTDELKTASMRSTSAVLQELGIMPHDGEYDDDLLEMYLEEADEELERLEGLISKLEKDPSDSACLVDVKRLLHTLKGSSNMAGATSIGYLTHEFEELLVGFELGSIEKSPLLTQLLGGTLTALRTLTDIARSREPLPAPARLILCARNTSDNSRIEKHDLDQALEEAWSLGSAADADAVDSASSSGEQHGTATEHDERTADVTSEAKPEPVPEPSTAKEEDARAQPDTNNVDSRPTSELKTPKGKSPAINPEPENSPGNQGKNKKASKVKDLSTSKFETRPGESFSETVHRLRSLRTEQKSDLQGGKATPPKIKVGTEVLDKMIDAASEVNVDHDRVIHFRETVEREEFSLRRLNESLLQHAQTLKRVLLQLDEYHLAHPVMLHPDYQDSFSELRIIQQDILATATSLKGVQDTLKDQTAICRGTTRNMTKLTRVLRDSLFDTRLVPIGNSMSTLRTTTRKTAEIVGKKVDFNMVGEHTKIDRNLLDALHNARVFDHMIRNSVDHGIEDPKNRIAAGKAEEGLITLAANQDGDQIILSLKDDGAGIDPNLVRQKAIEKGIISKDAKLDPRQMVQLILAPGFSTAKKLTQVSGRGVGMDVVRSTIEGLGGRLEVESKMGEGTELKICLPYTQGTSRALVTRLGQMHFAIPTQMIRNFAYVDQMNIGRGTARIEGVEYPCVALTDLCGLEHPDVDRVPLRVPMVVVEYERGPFAVQCIEVDGMQALHLKPAPAFQRELKGVLGVADSIQGELITVIDPRRLFDCMVEKREGEYVTRKGLIRPPPLRYKPLALVVDDSPALRKSAALYLEGMGYRVLMAENGEIALEQMKEHLPAVVVTDLEMPILDGFGLTKAIRASDRTAALPIIMITSRSTAEVEAEAQRVGVNCFLPKPFNPELLQEAIESAMTSGVS